MKKVDVVACTAPQCGVRGLPERMWLPAWDALRLANGGHTPIPSELNGFALCGKHGRLLREEGVRVYRFDSTLAQSREREERRQTERLSFRPFADKFLPKRREQSANVARS